MLIDCGLFVDKRLKKKVMKNYTHHLMSSSSAIPSRNLDKYSLSSTHYSYHPHIHSVSSSNSFNI